METSPFIDITITVENLSRDVRHLTEKFRPSWDYKKIKFQYFTEGKLNTCVCCKSTDDGLDDAFMIRINCQEMANYIDRKAEIRANQLIHRCGYASKVLGIFRNGFCYQFLPGQSLTMKSLRQDHIWKSIARGLAAIHSIQSDQPKKSKLFDVLDNYVQLIPEQLPDHTKNKMYKSVFPTKKHLSNELSNLEKHLISTETPIVFCHGDPRPENMIWNKHMKKIMFIDFEFSSHNYQAYDIAAHFYSFTGLQENPDFSLYPDENFQNEWLTEYLTWYHNFNNDLSSVTPKEVRKLYVQVQKFSLATHMMMAISGILSATMQTAEFDFFRFGIKRITEYFKYKNQILNLTSP